MRLTLQGQRILGLFIALLSGILIQYPQMVKPIDQNQLDENSGLPITTSENLIPTPLSSATFVNPTNTLFPTDTATPAPYNTLLEVWYVRVKLFPENPPEIIDVKTLQEGRISTLPTGDNFIRLLDDMGKVLYEIPFFTGFGITGSTEVLDEIEMIFILPTMEEQALIKILTPQGESIHELR
ncbi:MAG: hypothetical protein JEZ06_03605 [Anaerolineaceae bacterium]|nr:hypothetical protein [Anaerolineaceae bacterium]